MRLLSLTILTVLFVILFSMVRVQPAESGSFNEVSDNTRRMAESLEGILNELRKAHPK